MSANTIKSGRRARTAQITAGAAVLALGLTACGGANNGDENAVELNVASWATPDSVSERMAEWWYDEIEERSEGEITFNIDAADSLCSASEIPECVRDGRADIGQTITDYSSQLFPQATVSSIPFLNPNSEAVTLAVHELSTEHDGAAQLWEDNGLHPIAHVPPGRMLLGGQDDLSSIDELEGLRLRMSGQYAQHAVDAADANSVTLTAPETYEGLERGVADAAGFPLDGTVAYQLKDILPEWTDPGIGTYTTIGMWMNADVYSDLSEEHRAVVDEVTEEYNAEQAQRIYEEATLEQCDQLLETIGDLKQWDEAETQRWNEELGDSLEQRWVQDAESNGLEDAEGYLATYKEKLASYEGEIREDPTVVCAERS